MSATSVTPDERVRRPRGRPRDPRVEGVVLSATREILIERGFGRLTIAAVAESAGVGKGTIYLRWPDKESLVVAALREVWVPLEAPDTGVLRDDLLVVVREVAKRLGDTSGALFATVLGAMPRDSQLQRLWGDVVVKPWAKVLDTVIARGVERGEMREGIDSTIAMEALLGPVLSLTVVRGRKVTSAQCETLVDIYLGGVAR